MVNIHNLPRDELISVLQNSSSPPLRIGLIQVLPDVTECFAQSLESEGEACSRPGMSVELTQAVCDYLRFRCDFFIAPHRIFGNYLGNGTYNGLLDDVRRGIYDVGMPQYTPTTWREKAVDFSFTVRMGSRYWTTRFPSRVTFSLSSVYAFKPSTWALILSTILLLSLTSYFLEYWTSNKRQGILKIGTGFLDGLAMLFQQSPIDVYCRHSQHLLAFWGICALLLSAAYSSFILLTALAKRWETVFTDEVSLLACLEASRCRLMFASDSSPEYTAILLSKPGSRKSRFREILRDNPPIFASTALEKVDAIMGIENEFVVYSSSITRIAPMTRLVPECSLLSVEQEEKSKGRDVFIFPKNSTLPQIFNEAIVQLHAVGYINHVDRKYVGNPLAIQKNCFSQNMKLSPMAVGNYSGAAIPLGVAVFLAGLAFFFERLRGFQVSCRNSESVYVVQDVGLDSEEAREASNQVTKNCTAITPEILVTH